MSDQTKDLSNIVASAPATPSVWRFPGFIPLMLVSWLFPLVGVIIAAILLNSPLDHNRRAGRALVYHSVIALVIWMTLIIAGSIIGVQTVAGWIKAFLATQGVEISPA